MTEQQKLRAAYKLNHAARILKNELEKQGSISHSSKNALLMIGENIDNILKTIEPEIIHIEKGAKDGTFSYKTKAQVAKQKAAQALYKSGRKLYDTPIDDNNIGDRTGESGGRGGKGDHLWDLMYGKPD